MTEHAEITHTFLTLFDSGCVGILTDADCAELECYARCERTEFNLLVCP